MQNTVVGAFLALHAPLLRSLYDHLAPYAEMARRTGASVRFVKRALVALGLQVPRQAASFGDHAPDRLRMLYGSWASYRVMARCAGVDVPTVKQQLRDMGLAVPRRRQSTECSLTANRELLLRELGPLVSVEDLAQCTGLSPAAVGADLGRLGIGGRGLTMPQRRGILSGLDAGLTPEVVATAMGADLAEVLELRHSTGRDRLARRRPAAPSPIPSDIVVDDLRRYGESVSRCGRTFRIDAHTFSEAALRQRLAILRTQKVPSRRQESACRAVGA